MYRLMLLTAMIGIGLTAPTTAGATVLNIQLTLPKLDVDPYHRPYVAAWLETTDKQPVAQIALWADDPEWHKDLRRWWRTLGRYGGASIDAQSGATRRPDTYTITWTGKTHAGERVPPGLYVLHIEASREEGSRTYLRKEITLGKAATLAIPAAGEFGDIQIQTYN